MTHTTVERRLYDAAWDGCTSEVQSLLTGNPELDINWANDDHVTGLHAASLWGYFEIVKILLAHPHINVNVQNQNGSTPFSFSCTMGDGDVTVLQLLLKDPRVDVNLRDHEGRTLLWLASLEGHFSAVEWLIASKRDLEVNLKGHLDGQEYIALDIARVRRKNEVVALLERFTANPAQIRHEL